MDERIKLLKEITELQESQATKTRSGDISGTI